MNKLTHQFTSDQGKNMTVRIVLQGESYGLNNVLTHEKPMPLVEFYFRGTEAEAFISRYYLNTLIDTKGGQRTGLCLDGRMREYDLSSEDMAGVANFVGTDVIPFLFDKKLLSPHEILLLQVKALSSEEAEFIKGVLMRVIADGADDNSGVQTD